MTNKLKDNYEIRLRCATCGCEDQFEFNDDKSYIKCTFCNREYFGGIEELVIIGNAMLTENSAVSEDYLCKLEIKNTKDCVNWFNFFFVSNSR